MEAPSASPSSIAFPETARSPLSPLSPSKTKANHPYAIKTTSTAVLSRSNSLSGPAVTPVFYQASANAKPLGRSQSRGHRHSISLATFASSTPPKPLPLPPKRSDSFSSPKNDSIFSPTESLIAELPVCLTDAMLLLRRPYRRTCGLRYARNISRIIPKLGHLDNCQYILLPRFDSKAAALYPYQSPTISLDLFSGKSWAVEHFSG